MITLTSSRLRSLTQDGTILNEVSQDGSDILTGGVNTISERKKLYCEFAVEEIVDVENEIQLSLAGAKLYVSFALFMPSGAAYDFVKNVPNTGFSVILPSDLYEAGFDPIEMPFYSLGANTTNSAKNFKCYFTWLTELTFALEFEYYNTFDENGYFTSSTKSNLWRFFSEYWDQQNTNIVSESAYNVEKEIRLITHFQNSELTEDNIEYTETQEFRLWSGTLTSFDSESVFTTEDADTTLETLSTRNENPVVVKMYTAENTFDRFYGKLVKIQDDPDLNFIENYDLQETQLENGGVPTISENAFLGPITITRFDVGGYYELEFSINPDFLEEGFSYRIIIIGYDLGGVDYEGAFNRIIVSNPIPTTPNVPYCEIGCAAEYDYPTSLIFTPTLSDCNTEYNGNFLTCVIEERMRSKLLVDYSDNRWKNNIDCRKNNDVGGDTLNTNDIRKHLHSVEFEIYQEGFSAIFGGTTKHVHDYQIVTRTGANQYTVSSSNLSFTINTSTELITMYYDWRNRNETNVSNLFSFFNGQQYLAIENQYWGGKSFFIKWRLNFFYHDFRNPFTESLDIIQKMVVKDYDTNITVTNDFDLDFVCPDEQLCFDATIAFLNPEDYKLINIFELSPGQLYEEENWVPSILPQLSNIYIFNQDADYTLGDAGFCISPSTLSVNQSYNFSTLAKLT